MARSDRLSSEEQAALEREIELYKEVRQHILQEYIGDADAETMMLHALQGMTRSLDPHSTVQRSCTR